jgi:hypothetical protein
MSLFRKIQKKTKQEGTSHVAALGMRRIKNHIKNIPTVHLPYLYNKLFKSGRTFVFQQKKYRYFIREYNTTWCTERAVEIPVVMGLLQEKKGNVLEVGNVLSHYFSFKHDIVDKYEKGEGVINEDVTNLSLKGTYDVIVSISTLEHVGWDEKAGIIDSVDKQKISLAIANLKALLKPQGILMFTVPLGYNTWLDELIRERKLDVEKQFFLKRVAKDWWVEADLAEVECVKFGEPYFRGNGIMVGVVTKN